MKDNKTIFVIIVVGIALMGVGVGFIIIDIMSSEEKTTITELEDKIEQQIVTDILVPNQEFTVNMKGNTKHGDILTISGTVPSPNSSITGMVYHGGLENPTIVIVFQLTSDSKGFYTHDVVINDDYLWKQEGEYIISIQNEGIYKEIKFHRNW